MISAGKTILPSLPLPGGMMLGVQTGPMAAGNFVPGTECAVSNVTENRAVGWLGTATSRIMAGPGGFLARLWRHERRPPERGPSGSFLGRETINHNGQARVFYDLEAFVGTITAGLRADTSQDRRVGMSQRYADIVTADGIEKLHNALIAAGVAPTPARLDDSIFQTDDTNRSIVELASNSVDASRSDVKIKLKDGFYEVADTGKGMNEAVIVERLFVPKLTGKPDPSQQNGRFGIGFMTVLRHLKDEGDCVEVLTQSPEAQAHEIVYLLRNGRLKISAQKAMPSKSGGTIIKVNATGIKKREMSAEIAKYLRYVNDGRSVLVNGERASGFDFPLYDGLSRPGEYGRIFVNSGCERNSVTVKIGELIFESYDTDEGAIKGDVIIELPYSAKYAPTRDSAAMDEALYEYMLTLIGRAKTLEELNTLAPLIEKMDTRHDREPLMESARERAMGIVKSAHEGRRIYPARALIKSKISGTSEPFFIHPGLYRPEWLDRFETPREFISGELVSAGGWRRPLHLVLSPDIATPLLLDADSGVLYLNEAIYRERPEFVLSAVFMVPGMEFNVRWSANALATGGMETFDKRKERPALSQLADEVPAETQAGEAEAKTPAGEITPPAPLLSQEVERPALQKIAEFLEARGLMMSDSARHVPGGYSVHKMVDLDKKVYAILEKKGSSKKNIMDVETGRLFLERDAEGIDTEEMNGLIRARYSDSSLLLRPDGTILGKADDITTGEFDRLAISGNAVLFDKGGKVIARGASGAICCGRNHFWYVIGANDGTSRVLREDGTHFADGAITRVINIGGEDMIVISRDGQEHLTDERGNVILSGERVDVKKAGPNTYYMLGAYGVDHLKWMLKDGTVVALDADPTEAGGRAWFLSSSRKKVYDADGELFLEGDKIKISDTASGARFLITEGDREILLNEAKTVIAEGKQFKEMNFGDRIICWHVIGHDGRRRLVRADDRIMACWYATGYDGRKRLVRADGRRIAEGDEVVNAYSIEGNYFTVKITDKYITRYFAVKTDILRGGGDDAGFFEKDPAWVIEKDGKGEFRLIIGTRVAVDGVQHIYYAGGKKGWFVAKSGSHNKLLRADGTCLLSALMILRVSDVDSMFFVMRINSHACELRNEDGAVLARGEYIETRQRDGVVFVGVSNHARKKIYIKAGDRLILAGENILESEDDEVAKNYADLLPVGELMTLVSSPSLDARLGELKKLRLNVSACFYALAHADDELWRTFVDSRAKREILSLIHSSEALAFAEAHAEDDPKELKKALILMDRLPPLMGTDENLYMGRFERLMESGIDIPALISDLNAGRETEDILAVRHFLRDRDVVGIGRPSIARPVAKAKRLADVVTHIRLNGKSTGIEGAMKSPKYDCEVDRRELNHAIVHLNASHPGNYLKQLMQNSLDVQKVAKRVADDGHKIEADTFMDGPDFVFRMRDFGGMTEDEVMDLLKPGDGSKMGPSTGNVPSESRGSGRSGLSRGGYGEGFYSALAEAKWVRAKTAVAGSREAIVLDFEVIRGADGKINDILVRMEKEKNDDGFHGTVVETARYGKSPLLDASRARTKMRDMGQYISRHEASIFVNGTQVNDGRNGPLAETKSETIGRVALYDGLANRILLGKLPLTDLPDELWEAVPDGVKDYYRRKGFYIDLDHTKLRPAPTWDRLQNQAEVMATLKEILPALLIRGFLQRVAGADSAEDLNDLPEVYFVEAYKLAGRAVIGWGTARNADAINKGRFDDVDASKYFGEEGRQKLIKLMTLIKFVKAEGFDESLSLTDIHAIYVKAASGDETARTHLAKIKNAALPHGIRKRLEYAERIADSARANHERIKETAGLAPNRTYEMDEIQGADHKKYLSLAEKVAKLVWRHFGGSAVAVGINTLEDHAAFFAYHFARFGTYRLYRSYGSSLDADSAELAHILKEQNREAALAHFKVYLSRLYEVVTHELTHVLREHPDSFTHAPKFYQDQMDLMIDPPIIAAMAEVWMNDLR